MNNKKAQALVEFVLVLPIIIMILLVIIDFASIFYNKNHLEGILNDIVSSYDVSLTKDKMDKIINNDNITYSISKEQDLVTIELIQNVSLLTPFSNLIFSDPFEIKTSRTLIYE